MVLKHHLFETVLFHTFQEMRGNEYHLEFFQQSKLHRDVDHVWDSNIDPNYNKIDIERYTKLLNLLLS